MVRRPYQDTIRTWIARYLSATGSIGTSVVGLIVGVLDQQTYQGVPEVVDCAVRIVIGRPRTRRYVQGHGTQDLYRFGLPRWRTLRPVWGIKYGALRLVLVVPGGIGDVRLGTRPSFI
jgi:hypothetical protein